jgi:ketosteroid isomerase-like protein
MEYVNAFNNEDKQAVLDAYHPDAPSVPNRDNIYFRYQFTIDEFRVVEQSSDSAIVRTDVTLTDDNGDTETVVHTYELRPHDGEWDVYRFVVGTELPTRTTATESSADPTIPQVSLRGDYQESATEGSATGILTITHNGGDSLDGTAIQIEGSGIVAVEGATPDVTSTQTEWAAATGTEEVKVGDGITIGVEKDYDIQIIWMDSDVSSIIAEFFGPAA